MAQSKLNAAVDREIANMLSYHSCASCGTLYRPIFQLGRRQCQVHPEPRNYMGSLSNYEARLPRPPLNVTPLVGEYSNKPNHHSCCGSENPMFVDRPSRSRTIDQHGCTHSDHVDTLGWQQSITPSLLRRADFEPGQIANPGVVVNFAPTSVTLSQDERARHALSQRFYVFPLYFMKHLADVYNEELRLKNEPRPTIHAHYPVNSDDLGAVLYHFMGPIYQVVDNIESVLEPLTITFDVGTMPLIVNVRDAYAHLCTRFNLPRTPITRPDLVREHEQRRRNDAGASSGTFNIAQALYELTPDGLDTTLQDLHMSMDDGSGGGAANSLGDLVRLIKRDPNEEINSNAEAALIEDLNMSFFAFVIAPCMDATRFNNTTRVGFHYTPTHDNIINVH